MNKDIIEQFGSDPLFHAVVDGVELFIFDHGMNYLYVSSFKKLSLSIAEELRLQIIDFYKGKGGNFCNIIEFHSNADLDPNAREWGANRPYEVTSISDAFVFSGLAHRMIANFYLSINRPKKPTKFFKDLKSSISWSKEQLEKQKNP